MKTPSKEETKMFKVLVGYDKKNLLNMPTHIPWDMLNEEYARINHSQTLSRLNERGGLCVTEMLANIQKQRSRDWTVTQATVDELNDLVEKYNLSLKAPQSADVMTLEADAIMTPEAILMRNSYEIFHHEEDLCLKFTVEDAVNAMQEYAQYKSDHLQAELDNLKSHINNLIDLQEKCSERYKANFYKMKPNGHKVFDMFAGQLRNILKALQSTKQ